MRPRLKGEGKKKRHPKKERKRKQLLYPPNCRLSPPNLFATGRKRERKKAPFCTHPHDLNHRSPADQRPSAGQASGSEIRSLRTLASGSSSSASSSSHLVSWSASRRIVLCVFQHEYLAACLVLGGPSRVHLPHKGRDSLRLGEEDRERQHL